MTLYCPAHIEFLLWCHTRVEPYRDRHLAIYIDLIKELLKAGVIETDDGEFYRTTPKGKAWVEILCNTPEPTMAFVDEHGRVVKAQ